MSLGTSRIGFTGGVPASLQHYAVFASVATDVDVFLVDANGRTFAKYTVTVPTTVGGTRLSALVTAISAQAKTDFENALGAVLQVVGVGPVYFNTSVSPDSGTINVAVAATSPFSWDSGDLVAIGFVSSDSGAGLEAGAGSGAASDVYYNPVGTPYDATPGTSAWVKAFTSPTLSRKGVLVSANGGAEVQIATSGAATRAKWTIPGKATTFLAIRGGTEVWIKCSTACTLEEIA